MKSTKEIRARLARVSLDDLDAVHDLYLDSRKLPTGERHSPDLDAQEVARRVDRAMGQALLSGQARGLVKRHGQSGRNSNARSVTEFVPNGRSTDHYRYASLSNELFELALGYAKLKGNLTRESVLREVQVIMQIDPHAATAPPPPQVIPTRRGRRTLEHLAIQVSAIALGVQEVDPGEIDKVTMADVIEQAFEDIGIIRSFLRKVKKHDAEGS